MTEIEPKYLHKIAEATSGSARLAFRGLADSTWKVYSGATRRLFEQLEVKETIEHVRSPTFGKLYQKYSGSMAPHLSRQRSLELRKRELPCSYKDCPPVKRALRRCRRVVQQGGPHRIIRDPRVRGPIHIRSALGALPPTSLSARR